MSALIYLDPALLRPVVNGHWHRTRLTCIPAPGQIITMLCGEEAPAEFQPLVDRRARGVPHMCPRCDSTYRREQGIPLEQDRLRR
ncbi:hypothetical protein [Amycolatopsis nalaikhensis]|uniref:Zinc finger protein n=1 Tax=Amycolatopsis nalaikhensis TaxID=715472 RepID=A0ABY8XAG2_9PSEU|nr:hypothetical protein [Amycolatopsis sp. 2-2]WIV52895.1 hypothetical protein QP939_28540 [Amycolatopsis sp. 2-2]